MRINANDTIWVVTTPRRHSELCDICFETTLVKLRAHFCVGFSLGDNDAIFTEEHDAKAEAKRRLDARASNDTQEDV